MTRSHRAAILLREAVAVSRPVLTLILVVGVLAAPLIAESQPAGKAARVGFLTANAAAADASRIAAFRDEMTRLGYVEGRNLVFEFRHADGQYERLEALAADLVRLNVDVIVAAGGTPSVLAAKKATSTIPIVFATAGNPVGQGLVSSLARPGGNVTGLSIMTPELIGKQIELLKEVVPSLARIAYLVNPRNPSFTSERNRANAAAAGRALGLQLQQIEATKNVEIDAAFASMKREQVGAVIVARDAVLRSEQRQLIALGARYHLPTMFGDKGIVANGGLMSYSNDAAELYRAAARYVAKIINGAHPGDLPVEQPTKFELVVNLKTAKALGLTIPPAVLARADEVIQ
jgi:putative ABC transport system substrate-binding protein